MAAIDPEIINAIRGIEADVNALGLLIDCFLIDRFSENPALLAPFENRVQQAIAMGEVDGAAHTEAADLRQRSGEALRQHLENIRLKVMGT